jgi:hypothetical protein
MAPSDQMVKDIGEERGEIPPHTHWFLLFLFALATGLTLALSIETESREIKTNGSNECFIHSFIFLLYMRCRRLPVG